MPHPLTAWAREYTARPEVAAKLAATNRRIERREAARKAETYKPYEESYARGLAEHEARVAEAKARRQGCNPDAALAGSAEVAITDACEDNNSQLLGVDRRNLDAVDQGKNQTIIGEFADLRDNHLLILPVSNPRIGRSLEDRGVSVLHDDVLLSSANAVHDHNSTEFRCASCDGTNLTLGTRSGADEHGIEDSEDGGWCWDCGGFVEVAEVVIPATDVMDAEVERWMEVAA
ncbi:MAG: hypothetical protein EPO02_12955 [Nitrospirae bacterium]|nr:MAG: hypothetical protein EPO02_12955 [Nitrospirota bacterium]